MSTSTEHAVTTAGLGWPDPDPEPSTSAGLGWPEDGTR